MQRHFGTNTRSRVTRGFDSMRILKTVWCVTTTDTHGTSVSVRVRAIPSLASVQLAGSCELSSGPSFTVTISSRQNKDKEKDKPREPAKDKQRKKDDQKTDDVGLGLQHDDTLSPTCEQTAPVSTGADRSDMTKDMKSCLDAIHSSVDKHLTQAVQLRSATESRKRKPPDSISGREPDGCQKARKRGRSHEISCSEDSESDGYDSLSLPSLSSCNSRAESTFTFPIASSWS